MLRLWTRRLARLGYWTVTLQLPDRVRERVASEEIARSRLFDASHYLAQNPDIAQAGLDPILHYLRHGAEEGRDPSPYFSTRHYLETHTDVAHSGINPLYHFVIHGAKESRSPHPHFDIRYYMSRNPLLESIDVNPLLHYMELHRSYEGEGSPLRPHPHYASVIRKETSSRQKSQLAQVPRSNDRIEGGIDRASSSAIFGWARDRGSAASSLRIDILLDNEPFAVARADRLRVDLARRFSDAGRHGFVWEIPPLLFEKRSGEVRFRARSQGQDLDLGCVEIPVFAAGERGESLAGEASSARIVTRYTPSERRLGGLDSVEVIVLNRDGAEQLERFLAAFTRHNTCRSLQITVVDHGSCDASREVVERWRKRLPLRWLSRGENRSFSESNNVAARASSADFLIFANNDVYLDSDALPRLLEVLRDPAVAIAGLQLFDPPVEPGLAPESQHAGVLFDRFRRTCDPASSQLIAPFEVRVSTETSALAEGPVLVPAVTAAFLAVRRATYEALGGFDESYYYGYEDVDFCLSAAVGGLGAVVAVNDIAATHDRGATRRELDPEAARRVKANPANLDRRFGALYRRWIRRDLFARPGYWGVTGTRIGFITSGLPGATIAGDCFSGLELARALEAQHACECVFIPRTPGPTDVAGIDVLISLLDDFALDRIENASPHLIKVAWIRNWFERFANNPAAESYDLVWASSRRAAAYLRARLAKPVAVVPLATCFEFFATGRRSKELESDYCFTGSYWNQQREIAKFLDPSALSHRGKIFGGGWEDTPALREITQGPHPYEAMPDVYASTRLVIDDANHVTRPWGSVNSRVFDALAAGRLAITNGVMGSHELFGGRLPTWQNKAELEGLIEHYLGDDEARERRVAELRAEVEAHHTYAARADQVWGLLSEAAARSLRFAIKIGAPSRSVAAEWGDAHFARGIARALTRLGHSVRIDCLDAWECGESIGDDVVLVLRGLSRYRARPDQLNLMWMISHPEDVTREECEEFHHVFVASSSHAARLRSDLRVPVSVLLQCCDGELFHPGVAVADEMSDSRPDLQLPRDAVVLVGNSRNQFRSIVRDCIAADVDFHVIGTLWERFLPPDRVLAQHVDNHQLGTIYRESLVVLNDHWKTMRDAGFLSNRLFDAAACGAQIVSDRVAGLEEVFGEVVKCYESPQELGAIVASAAEAREAEASARHDLATEILKHHTFDVRIREIMKVVEARWRAVAELPNSRSTGERDSC